MKLLLLENGQRQVAAVKDEDGLCPVLKFMKEAPSSYRGSAKGFGALFKRYAQGGRQLLSTELFHEADREDGIWEFIKGRLRVYCFMDGDGHLVILSHGVVKKTQKTRKQDVEQAARLKERYAMAKQEGRLEVINDE
jgi:phage-related protein